MGSPGGLAVEGEPKKSRGVLEGNDEALKVERGNSRSRGISF